MSEKISITKEELDNLIETAVKKAIETTTSFFEEKLNEQRERIDQLQNRLKKAEIANNKLEQYSRRSHLRIHGLKLKSGENCKQAVCKFISNRLSDEHHRPLRIQHYDLDAAHPLPLRPREEEETEEKQRADQPSDGRRPKPRIPTIIVRFHCRDMRDAVIRARKQLKNSGITITEDLTTKNALLLRRLQTSEHFQSAWSWEGKIFAKHRSSGKDSKPVKFDIYDA
jgi:hypothetical protein